MSAAYYRERYATDPAFRAAKKIRARKRREQQVAEDPQFYRRKALRERYGLTLEEFEARAKAQSGRCAICGKEYDELLVDHDHRDGHIRGLLCRRCNLGLGHFDDDRAALEAAIGYLDER